MNQERTLMRSLSESAVAQRAAYRALKEKSPPQKETGGAADGQKRCFKCQQLKSLNDFYKHPQMSDGRLGKCKDCTKSDVSGNYHARLEQCHAYDTWRTQTAPRKTAKAGYQRNARKRNPAKAKARNAVGNAIRDGKLIRQPCEICGNPKSQAHHEDYSKPLAVRWLCFKHHREIGHGQIVLTKPF